MKCAILLFALLAPLLHAQMFTVVNEKGIKFNQEEANRIYKQVIDCVRSEYHVVEPLAPTFVLVLGVNKEQQGIKWPNFTPDWDGASVSLNEWNPTLFRRTVMLLTINELLRPQNIVQLSERLERQDAAMISVQDLKRSK
jgi:hypothetical protein